MGSFLSAFAPCETEVAQYDSATKPAEDSLAKKASAVFSIPELLEHILLLLPTPPRTTGHLDEPTTQLFMLQRVNSTFRATILGSKALRLQMDARCQFEMGSPLMAAQGQKYGALMRANSRKSDARFNYAFHKLVDLHMRLHIGHAGSTEETFSLLGHETYLDRSQIVGYAELALVWISPEDMAFIHARVPHQSWMSVKVNELNAEGDKCIRLLYTPRLTGAPSEVIRGEWQTERSTTWRDVVAWMVAVQEYGYKLQFQRRELFLGQRRHACYKNCHLAMTESGRLVEVPNADCRW